MSGTPNFCASIYQALQHAVNEQLGPQNLIDVLRLLQLVTYENNFVVGNWTFDLIKYLHEEMQVDLVHLTQQYLAFKNQRTRGRMASLLCCYLMQLTGAFEDLMQGVQTEGKFSDITLLISHTLSTTEKSSHGV